jgi:hypothetical protein
MKCIRRKEGFWKFFWGLLFFSLGGFGEFSVSYARNDLWVDSLRCEYLSEPMGVETLRPRLSWVIHSEQRGTSQGAYQILTATSEEKLAKNQPDVWDSGKVSSEQSLHVEYAGPPLQSAQRYFWKVRIWDQKDQPSAWSRPASWTTGLLKPEDWKASWIQISKSPEPSEGDSLYPLPIFRKGFSIQSNVRRAVLFVSGLGQMEVFLNGRKVGDHFLDPAWSVYEKTVYYNTFDITDLLQKGPNAFGVMLGKGFYNTKGDRRIHFVKADRPLKLLLQAHIFYKDGSEQIVCSDGSWKWTRGPYTHNAILGGSSYDARLLPDGWAKGDFDDSSWLSVEETAGPGGRLSASVFPPVKKIAVQKAVSIEEPEPGYFVYNFGQNASYVPQVTLMGPAGAAVRMTPAEQRHGQTGNANNGKGRVDQARIGKPNYWEYTLRGEGLETWTDAFCYTGFQYLEISGAVPEGYPNPAGLPVIKELSAVQVRNASERTGRFVCSKPLFNDIARLIDWAVQSNMSHVLTDCPHREKLGWLEQTYLMGPSILWDYDAAAFFAKIIRDIRDSQDSSGQIFTVAPSYPVFEGAFQYSPEWGAAGVFLPWLMYQWYGDTKVLQDNYQMMSRFVDWMEKTSDNLIALPGLGDWYDYGHGQSLGPSRFTPKTLTSTAVFYGCAEVVSKTAALLGHSEDAERYALLCKKIKERFNQEFFDGRGTYQNHGSPQTANAMALVFGLNPEGTDFAVLNTILEDLKQRNYQQTAGDVGYHYLVQALSNFDQSDVLYRITDRDNVGSYGYFIKQGWTSLPEAWDATLTSSMNHLMLGHILQWFQQGLAGIRPDPTGPGFKKSIIKPEIVGDMTWCKGTVASPYGKIETSWKVDNRRFILEVVIPTPTTATVFIPASDPADVMEGNRRAVNSAGVTFERKEGRNAVFTILSGQYRFESPLP